MEVELSTTEEDHDKDEFEILSTHPFSVLPPFLLVLSQMSSIDDTVLSIDSIFHVIAKKSRKEIFFTFFLANIFLLTLIDIVPIITFIFEFVFIKIFVSEICYFSSWGTFCLVPALRGLHAYRGQCSIK